jgi:hypothetical protein
MQVAQKRAAVLGQRHASTKRLKARRLDSFQRDALQERPDLGSVVSLVTPIRLTQRSAELIAGLQSAEYLLAQLTK